MTAVHGEACEKLLLCNFRMAIALRRHTQNLPLVFVRRKPLDRSTSSNPHHTDLPCELVVVQPAITMHRVHSTRYEVHKQQI